MQINSKDKQIIILILLSILACSVLSLRIFYTQSKSFFFLFWNLFLAWLPLIFALGMSIKNKILKVFSIILWFFFFPNSLYIITDFLHIRFTKLVPVWFDVMMINLFALTGMFLGFMSLRIIEKNIAKRFNDKITTSMVVLALIAASFGIYLGRFLRWNSWDLFTQPDIIFLDVISRIIFPFNYPGAYLFTFVFSIFFILLYFFFRENQHKS